MKRALVTLSLLCTLPAFALDADTEEAIHDTLVEDPTSFGRTPKELWEQFDNFYLAKLWIQSCARLDKLREKGADLSKKRVKASYAYTRCAAIHLKLGRLGATDAALGLAKDLHPEDESRKPVEADLHRLLAKQALEKKDLSQALAHFELAAARHKDEKKESEASLLLTRYAQAAADDGRTQEAKEAVSGALVYYPENRDALKLQDSLAFWSRAVWVLGGIGVLAILLIVITSLRRKPQPTGYDPYDPYAG